jgi:hypothetical protein
MTPQEQIKELESQNAALREALEVAACFTAYDSEAQCDYPFSASLAYKQALSPTSGRDYTKPCLRDYIHKRECAEMRKVLVQILTRYQLYVHSRIEESVGDIERALSSSDCGNDIMKTKAAKRKLPKFNTITLNDEKVSIYRNPKGVSHGCDIRAVLHPLQQRYTIYRQNQNPPDDVIVDTQEVRSGETFYSVPPCHMA